MVPLLLSLFFSSILCDTLSFQKDLFEQFAKQYNREYTPEELPLRFKNFQASLERIQRLNEAGPKQTAQFALNQFSDLSPQEFREKWLMPQVPAAALATSCLAKGITQTLKYPDSELSAIPTSWDWRTKGNGGKGIVTPVKNQGQCGSCWTFSTTGNIESLYAMKGNPLTTFSEQLIVDCSHGCSNEPPYGDVCNQGCNGGWPWNAFFDIMSWGGLQTEAQYPYVGVTGTCHSNSKQFIAPIKNYTCFSGPDSGPANETQLAAWIYQNGPVSIALDAALLMDYSSGIINPYFPNYQCDPTVLDHALLIVGYGEESDWLGVTPYWIVKNSWGTGWGESGYFRIYRGENLCGIANAVSTAVM